MTAEPTTVTPVVTLYSGEVHIENIHGNRHYDALFLHDPDDPEYSSEGSYLSLSRAQAEIVRDRLIELLAEKGSK
jgi:hypothetical protein